MFTKTQREELKQGLSTAFKCAAAFVSGVTTGSPQEGYDAAEYIVQKLKSPAPQACQ